MSNLPAKSFSKKDRSVKDKWILLTGASGGIGEAIAIHLYNAGANLVLVGRDQYKLSNMQDRNHFTTERTRTIAADLNKQQDRKEIVALCNALSEPVSILINNAGISDFHFLDNQNEQLINNIITTNLTAPILLTQALIPILQTSKQPMIVNMGSTFGSIAYPGFVVYSASKFGLRGFTEALRRELANTAIDVCYIAPRATKTAINSDSVNAMNTTLGTAMDNPDSVAIEVLKAIEQRKSETYIGWPEKLFTRINQLLPKIVDNVILKQMSVISRFAHAKESPAES